MPSSRSSSLSSIGRPAVRSEGPRVKKNDASAPPRSPFDVPVPRYSAPCLDIESKGSRPISASSSSSSTSFGTEVMPLSQSSSLSSLERPVGMRESWTASGMGMKNGADAPPRSLMEDVPAPRRPAPCLHPADIESKGFRPVSASSSSSSTSLGTKVAPLSRSSSLSSLKRLAESLEEPFAGVWTGPPGSAGAWTSVTIVTISAETSTAIAPDGFIYKVSTDGDRIALHLEDEVVRGRLEDRRRIVWNDGDIWERQQEPSWSRSSSITSLDSIAMPM